MTIWDYGNSYYALFWCEFKRVKIGHGIARTFHEQDDLAIVDLYEELEKVGTLTAVLTGATGQSRLEYQNKNLGFFLSCRIN